MENLEIKGYSGDYFIPSVNFDSETGICTIAGESYIEETVKFYTPLLKWFEQYMTEKVGTITFNIKLTYFNTSSSKRVLDMLLLLKDYEDDGGSVTVNWYFEEEDSDIEEDVEDLMIISELNINKFYEFYD